MKYSTLLLALLLASCATNTGTGVIAGGVFGASICGATYGSKGAVIGSTAAMITCGLIGAALDVQDRRIMEKNSPRTVDRIYPYTGSNPQIARRRSEPAGHQ